MPMTQTGICSNCDSLRKTEVKRHASGGFIIKLDHVCINRKRWPETPHKTLPDNTKACKQKAKREGPVLWLEKKN